MQTKQIVLAITRINNAKNKSLVISKALSKFPCSRELSLLAAKFYPTALRKYSKYDWQNDSEIILAALASPKNIVVVIEDNSIPARYFYPNLKPLSGFSNYMAEHDLIGIQEQIVDAPNIGKTLLHNKKFLHKLAQQFPDVLENLIFLHQDAGYIKDVLLEKTLDPNEIRDGYITSHRYDTEGDDFKHILNLSDESDENEWE